ncbi:MAG: AIM24 family protein, partial [Erysipelothrix sp.]|nr:AIM24 family protein [Erysipelothrix sp.]
MKYEIFGDLLPAVRINLEKGETVFSQVGGRTWARGDIETETKGGGLGKMMGRAFTGESMFLSHYTANEDAEIVFSSNSPGNIKVFELAADQSIIAQKHSFLVGTEDVTLQAYMSRKISTGLVGGEGFLLQKITGPGLGFVEIDGYGQEIELGVGEEIVCDTGVMAVMDDTCTISVRQ